MTDERGQALVIAALVLGIAAVVIGGLRLSQDAILATGQASRAGEAAVEAAAAVVADAYVRELRDAALSTPVRRPDVARAVTDPAVREGARAVASDLSLRNGGGAIDEVTITCDARGVEVVLVQRRVSFRAGFRADECFRP
jgi:type II secretory pathway component PulK